MRLQVTKFAFNLIEFSIGRYFHEIKIFKSDMLKKFAKYLISNRNNAIEKIFSNFYSS